MKKMTWGVTITLLVILYLGLNHWITNGILQVPDTEIFLSNYNDLDKTKTWDQLRGENPSLDPSRAPWSKMAGAPKPTSMTIEPVNEWEEFAYPKTVVAVHLNITIGSSTTYYLRAPTLLVLILDENGEIRGKLCTSAPSPESSDSRQSFEIRFWFRLPQGMVERQYGIVAELFGKTDWKPAFQGDRMNIISDQLFVVDDVYGVLPAWDYSASHSYYSVYYTLLDYARDDIRVAPPSTFSFRNMVGDISIVSAFIPTLLGALVVFRKQLATFIKRNPEVASGIVYILLSLILFSALIVAFVLFR
jgi:hypothetical protein